MADKFMQLMKKRNPDQPEFLQAVSEVAQAIIPYIEEHPQYKKANIMERLTEAERIIIFPGTLGGWCGKFPCKQRLPGTDE